MELVYLCAFAFLAGFVDAIAGGGGLIQMPALFLFLPQMGIGDAVTILGTNKCSSICGTSAAMVQYARRIKVDWHSVLPAGAAAFLLSFLGALVVSLIPSATLRPLVLVLLIGVAIYTFVNKNLGGQHRPRFQGGTQTALAVATGCVIGFYDGFFGPGTGSFLVFIFIGIFGFDFLTASASAKVINVATNLSAMLFFASTGRICYVAALPMGVCNVLGSIAGSRMAILRGNRFVRGIFLLVAGAMILRFGYEALFK